MVNKEQCATKKAMVICISGMAGTGKSTLSQKIAKKYNLKYYSGGDALKDLAKAEGYTISDEGWWESPIGLKFLERRLSDPKFDRAVDEKFLEYAKQGNVLLDSWTMPWLLEGGFKIWLSASLEKRAARVAQRDKISIEEAFRFLNEKEAQTKAIYKKLYGFELDKDFEPFDFILDTNNLTADEVFQVLCKVIDNVVLSNT
ncbi:MAG: cytidylate kinase family protein [Candidatus Bathyarchaeota archaeon]|jgi:cytidylate kinase|nr:cytidylate kinase family protein [Candidatus Bathyarchaeota archaeon]